MQPLYFGVSQAGTKDVPAGVRWFPWTIPLAIIILVTFVIISRWNLWIYAIWMGWLLVLFGVAMTTFYTRTSSDGKWVSIAIVSGAGIGILFPSLHTASELIASRENDDERQRRAVTNSSFFHYLGKDFCTSWTPARHTTTSQRSTLLNLYPFSSASEQRLVDRARRGSRSRTCMSSH
jgi:hypothetical protein